MGMGNHSKNLSFQIYHKSITARIFRNVCGKRSYLAVCYGNSTAQTGNHTKFHGAFIAVRCSQSNHRRSYHDISCFCKESHINLFHQFIRNQVQRNRNNSQTVVTVHGINSSRNYLFPKEYINGICSGKLFRSY